MSVAFVPSIVEGTVHIYDSGSFSLCGQEVEQGKRVFFASAEDFARVDICGLCFLQTIVIQYANYVA